ncbi:MAG: CRISPR-associated helicase Cas3' [Sedimentisphaerales bacterium]|nr:CRISPR-associated helicase Cas3' [Sedimentisphaerales bacterium]
MNQFDGRLLAKSWRAGYGNPADCPWLFLGGHAEAVYDAAVQVLEFSADHQLRALGLDVRKWRERFRRIVLAAAALHDMGKANDHFQEMVRRQRPLQALRHEWVGLLILEESSLREWLRPAVGDQEADWHIVLWAITGHHPACSRSSPPQSIRPGTGSQLRVLSDSEDFASYLRWLALALGLNSASCPNVLRMRSIPLVGADRACARIARVFRQSVSYWDRFSPEEKHLVAAAKGCVVACDVAGSALPTVLADAKTRSDWISHALSRKPTPEQVSEIIDERLRDRETGEPRKLRPFQMEVGKAAGTITLVRAGCGSGKTLAAYHWARSACPNKRVYFCYPTTGTATEGYRDYLFSPEGRIGRAGAALFHGRAAVDLDQIVGVVGDADDVTAAHEENVRIESLDAWSTPIVACTADMVLGLVQNNRRGLYAWPSLADCAYVFDEIHAYDDRLFGALLRFIQAMRGSPMLLMTASLPESRRRAVERSAKAAGTALCEIPRTPDLEELERRPRYHRWEVADEGDPMPDVQIEVAGGGKVLWVCNTVARAMSAADRATATGIAPIVYHSRFRYEDRVARHQRVIEAFEMPASDCGVLAVCTQVAEMSLDLSARMLVTDLAPVPSLMQRLGRLNRRASPGDPTCPFLVLTPRDVHGRMAPLPYTSSDLETAQQWLSSLPTAAISQQDLAQTWEASETADWQQLRMIESAWLDGGPSTQVLELREASPGMTVILEDDAGAVRRGSKRWVEVALPMPPPPRNVAWKEWDNVKGIPVAPRGTIDYDTERGARWHEPGHQ